MMGYAEKLIPVYLFSCLCKWQIRLFTKTGRSIMLAGYECETAKTEQSRLFLAYSVKKRASNTGFVFKPSLEPLGIRRPVT